MIMWLERIGSVDKVVRCLYLVLLALIAWMVFADVAKKRRKEREALRPARRWTSWPPASSGTRPCTRSRSRPWFTSKWPRSPAPPGCLSSVSFLTGWLAGILGIGGGLIRMPALIYFIGCPTHVAVGTDLFEVMISGLYGDRHLHLQGPHRAGGRHHHARRRGHRRPGGHGGHQVHQGLRHPHRLRPGRGGLRPVHRPQTDGQGHTGTMPRFSTAPPPCSSWVWWQPCPSIFSCAWYKGPSRRWP